MSGTIAEIASYGQGMGGGGLRAKLQTSSGDVDVMLGPAAYVTSQAVKLAKGDRVEVIGWRVQSPRWGEQIVARQVRRGNDTLELRDAKGFPSWAAGASQGFGGPPDDSFPCAHPQ